MATEPEEADKIRKLIFSAHQSAVDAFRRWAEMFGDEHAKAAIFVAADMIEMKAPFGDNEPIFGDE